MPIQTGLAVYGERNRGHALLSASPLASGVAQELVYQMDIQGTVPPGLEWQPFLSGFVHADWYVVSRTTPALTGRQGMVRSQAIFIRQDDIGELDDLQAAIDALDLPAEGEIGDVEIGQKASRGEGNLGLAAALLHDAGRPVVWPSQDGFDAAVAGLWRNLWPDARLGLSFRLAFSPSDVAGREPTLVSVPSQLTPRWTGHRIVDPKATTEDEAASLLAGRKDGAQLRLLIKRLNAKLSAFADLGMVVDVAHALDGKGDTTDLIQALRLVGVLSPNRGSGSADKSGLIDLAARRLSSASTAEIRMARNLDLAAFDDPKPVWAAVQRRVAETLLGSTAPEEAAGLLQEALIAETAVQPWRAAIVAGLAEGLRTNAKRNAGQLWKILAASPALLAPILRMRLRPNSLQFLLANAAPERLEGADELIAASVAAGAVQLHAACCAATLPAPAAIKRHVGEMTPDDASLDRILWHASGAERIEIALAHNIPHLFDAAVEAASAKPALLSGLDLDSARTRKLWRATTEANPAAWDAPRHVHKAFAILLDEMLDAGIRDDPLMSAMAASPLADIAGHPRRSEIWRILPGGALPGYRAATAEGWNRAFASTPGAKTPESIVADELLKPEFREPMLRSLAADPAEGARYFRTLPSLTERQFTTWLDEVAWHNAALAPSDAEAIGRLVAARSWRDSAMRLSELYLEGRDDLRPALAFCHDLFSYLRLYLLDMLGSTPAKVKWGTLQEVAIDLYGYGPSDKGIWERSGGKAGDVPKGATGADVWRKIFADAERGKRVISMRQLIRTMADEYPGHSTLIKLRYDSFFG